MAIVLQTAATNYASISSEMLFVAYEATKANDDVIYPNYQYVCDVYVASTLIGRMKTRPDPTHKKGVFDVSRLLQAYITSGLKANYANATETYTVKIEYLLKFGEEYSDTLYTNLLVDSSNRAAYTSYEVRPFDDAVVYPTTGAGWASTIPDTIFSSDDVRWQLLPFFDNASGVPDFDYRFYNSAGVQIGSTGTISAAGMVGKTVLQLNVGFVKLAAASGLSQAQKDAVSYYEVDNPIAAVNTKTIKLQCDKYPAQTVVWMNRYGAYDSYYFGLVSKKQTEISRKDYEKLPYTWNSSGVVSYSADGVYYGGKKGFATNMKISLKLTSHLLNEDEYDWLSEMFHSPDVYLYDSTLDKFLPVTIQENQYEYRNYLNSRLKPLEFNVNYADMYNAQRL